MNCFQCNEAFSVADYRRNTAKFCSRSCHGRHTASGRVGNKNPNYGKDPWNKGMKFPEKSGVNNPNWKGGKSKSTHGYLILTNDYRFKYEHREIMEKVLGRKLRSDEIVHHVNHNKQDNRIENLMIVTRQEHIKIHQPLRMRWNR